MCGIVGVWNYRTRRPVDRGLLDAMIAALHHRGPDDLGSHFDDHCGLGFGFRRLAIIDLSPGGHQPMVDPTGNVAVVFNGEIYNFPERRETLAAAGHRFRSRSDTEVIVHQYLESGPSLVSELDGMFAFAIWDSRRHRLVLARDRFGKKPLYYHDDGQRFVFASELKALLVDRTISRRLDVGRVVEHLQRGYVVSPRTVLEGIVKLPPAHVAVVEGGRTSLEQYWSWVPAFRRRAAGDEVELGAELGRCLKQAVRRRLLSDVPLGAFLSGGIDSTAVVATMAELTNGAVKTFTVDFEDEEFSEARYARAVATHLGTEHHEITVRPDAMVDLLPSLAYLYDEPVSDPSVVPTYYVCRAAREHVTVCLSGDGGDEVLAGYDRYVQAMTERPLDVVPVAVRRAAFAMPARLLPLRTRGARFVRRARLPFAERYLWATQVIADELLHDLMLSGAPPSGISAAHPCWQLEPLAALQCHDAHTYLPENILFKVDRASMASSLEVRAPFLDRALAEFAATLPADARLRGRTGKRLLRQTLKSRVPDEVLERKKRGFGIPGDHWLRRAGGDFVKDLLLGTTATRRGIFRPEAVAALVKAHASGSHRTWRAVWALLMFELWCQAYLDG